MSHSSPDSGSGPQVDRNASTSTSLLEAVKAMDEEAWRRLVDIYTPLIYGWCRHSGLTAEDSKDVGQEVLQAVAAKVRQFRRERPTDSFHGWIWKITRNKVRDHYRHRHRELEGDGGTDALRRLAQVPDAPPSVTTESGPLDSETAVVHRALAVIRCRFDEVTWQAFWRTTVERQRGVDVAADLGMNAQAVYQAKYRVLRRLREELADLVS